MTSGSELEKYCNFAKNLALHVGDLTISKWSSVRFERAKYTNDLVTNLDVESEEMIVREIEKTYPTHNILSEERDEIRKSSDWTWVIDPIDGSRNFLRHLPIFGISIGLKHGDTPMVGVIYHPPVKTLFAGFKNGGAWANHDAISVSRETNLHLSVFTVEFPSHQLPKDVYEDMLVKNMNLERVTFRSRALACSSLSLAYSAQGSFEGYVDLSVTTKEWDFKAGQVIFEEAGGVFNVYPSGIKIGTTPILMPQIVDVLGI